MVRQGKAIAIRRQRHRRLPPSAPGPFRVRVREIPGLLLPPRDAGPRLRSQVLSDVSRGTFPLSSRPVRDDRNRAVAPGNGARPLRQPAAADVPVPCSPARVGGPPGPRPPVRRPSDPAASPRTGRAGPIALGPGTRPAAGRGWSGYGRRRPAGPESGGWKRKRLMWGNWCGPGFQPVSGPIIYGQDARATRRDLTCSPP